MGRVRRFDTNTAPMDVKDIALVAHIEANGSNLNTQMQVVPGAVRMYESEAVRCFKSWRQNAGWLKDINIYCVCCTKNTISQQTVEQFSALGVSYIESYEPNSESFSSGFITIPWCGKFFEQPGAIPENILVKIDLDNVVMKPFPVRWFDNLDKQVVVGQYNEAFDDIERHCYEDFPFDTSLIIEDKRMKFYELYYSLCFDDKVLKSKEWEQIKAQTGEYWLEEFVVDYINHNNLASIMPVRDYQYGQGYPSMSYFITKHRTQDLCMSHNHIVA